MDVSHQFRLRSHHIFGVVSIDQTASIQLHMQAHARIHPHIIRQLRWTNKHTRCMTAQAPAFCKCMRIFWQPPMQSDTHVPVMVRTVCIRTHCIECKTADERDGVADTQACCFHEAELQCTLAVWVHGEFPFKRHVQWMHVFFQFIVQRLNVFIFRCFAISYRNARKFT